MTPIEISDPEKGPWGVRGSDGKLRAWGLASNAAAWRWIDRQSGDPVSRSEKVGEWLWNKIVNGER
jgi:hypothetical protein